MSVQSLSSPGYFVAEPSLLQSFNLFYLVLWLLSNNAKHLFAHIFSSVEHSCFSFINMYINIYKPVYIFIHFLYSYPSNDRRHFAQCRRTTNCFKHFKVYAVTNQHFYDNAIKY